MTLEESILGVQIPPFKLFFILKIEKELFVHRSCRTRARDTRVVYSMIVEEEQINNELQSTKHNTYQVGSIPFCQRPHHINHTQEVSRTKIVTGCTTHI